MKLNFDITMKEIDGTEVKTSDGTLMQMRTAIINSLLVPEDKIEGAEKLLRFNLAQRVHKGGDIELTTEEVAKIKDLVGRFMTTIVVGQVYNHIENNKEG